jgi:hypothetical protein
MRTIIPTYGGTDYISHKQSTRVDKKYRRFFKLHFTPIHQWIKIVSLYLEDT